MIGVAVKLLNITEEENPYGMGAYGSWKKTEKIVATLDGI